MRVIYHRGALRDVESIQTFIARENPAAARDVVIRIEKAVNHLANSPQLGRPGPGGIRLLSVAGLPYVVIYRVGEEAISIVAIFHTSRDRQF